MNDLFLADTPSATQPPIFMMCVCHAAFCPKFQPEELAAISCLTKTMAEYTLAILQDNKSMQAYAQETGRAVVTVEDGLRKAREKLGFHSKGQLREWLWRMRFTKF